MAFSVTDRNTDQTKVEDALKQRKPVPRVEDQEDSVLPTVSRLFF
jgi:hypothetical protein